MKVGQNGSDTCLAYEYEGEHEHEQKRARNMDMDRGEKRGLNITNSRWRMMRLGEVGERHNSRREETARDRTEENREHTGCRFLCVNSKIASVLYPSTKKNNTKTKLFLGPVRVSSTKR